MFERAAGEPGRDASSSVRAEAEARAHEEAKEEPVEPAERRQRGSQTRAFSAQQLHQRAAQTSCPRSWGRARPADEPCACAGEARPPPTPQTRREARARRQARGSPAQLPGQSGAAACERRLARWGCWLASGCGRR